MNKFKKKIKCLHCNGYFKKKSERGKRKTYVCTNYDSRNGKCNKRVAIPEQQLLDVILKRYEIRSVNIDVEEVADRVEEVLIEDKLLFRIKLKDFGDEIIYGKNHINY